jgi:hypothetical protein
MGRLFDPQITGTEQRLDAELEWRAKLLIDQGGKA